MIFPDAEFDLRSSNPRRTGAREPARSREGGRQGRTDDKTVPPGSYSSAAIILLTDGQTTTGPDPIESARIAADRGVRVYTVGIGTPSGETIGAEGWSMRVRLDEQALKMIANVTQGEYFYAGTATDLQKIYKNLNTKLFFEQRETEISALFAAAAAGARAPVGTSVAALVQPDSLTFGTPPPVASAGSTSGRRCLTRQRRTDRRIPELSLDLVVATVVAILVAMRVAKRCEQAQHRTHVVRVRVRVVASRKRRSPPLWNPGSLPRGSLGCS